MSLNSRNSFSSFPLGFYHCFCDKAVMGDYIWYINREPIAAHTIGEKSRAI